MKNFIIARARAHRSVQSVFIRSCLIEFTDRCTITVCRSTLPAALNSFCSVCGSVYNNNTSTPRSSLSISRFRSVDFQKLLYSCAYIDYFDLSLFFFPLFARRERARRRTFSTTAWVNLYTIRSSVFTAAAIRRKRHCFFYSEINFRIYAFSYNLRY